MRSLIDAFGSSEPDACTCAPSVEDGTLRLAADDCDGDLATAADCRETVVRTLGERDAERIVVRSNGLESQYCGRAVALLSAAGRFVDLIADRDERLADLAARNPIDAAREATARAGPIADVAAETGLAIAASGIALVDALAPNGRGLAVAHSFVDERPPEGGRLRSVTSLEGGADVRIYDRPETVPRYALDPVDLSLSADERRTVLDAYAAIASGEVDGNGGDDRAASRAIAAIDGGPPDPRVTRVLAKHTAGYGVLEDLFDDPRVSDVYATSPVAANPLRAVVDGESMTTNVHLTTEGAGALASRVRRTSGRAFSRAQPTVDATAALGNGTGIRIAGVTDPVADGDAFAFRERAADAFTLPALVANGTLTAEAAGFLSFAVERNAAVLVAGTRGAGKTTLLGTLLYELSAETRTVVIEDTPELPIASLQSADRDVQALRTGTGDGPEIAAADALETALRLGDGALVVGEIRGEEAPVLYEAMRVGANANAVLGTIHGDGGDAVYERVVSDLGVPPSSFEATDLVVTVQAFRTPEGRCRRLAAIEEVVVDEEGVRFEPLYAHDRSEIGDDPEESEPADRSTAAPIATATGRIDRGESRLLDRLTEPNEAYADARRALASRRDHLAALAADGRTRPDEVAAAVARRDRRSDDGTPSIVENASDRVAPSNRDGESDRGW